MTSTERHTSTSRVAKHRRERKNSGMVRLSDMWTWPKYVERIKNYVAKLNKGE